MRNTVIDQLFKKGKNKDFEFLDEAKKEMFHFLDETMMYIKSDEMEKM